MRFKTVLMDRQKGDKKKLRVEGYEKNLEKKRIEQQVVKEIEKKSKEQKVIECKNTIYKKKL